MTYGRPGVYINERQLASQATDFSSANAAGACIGAFQKGPTTVTKVNSWYDFVSQFGGYNASFPSTFGVGQFFANGGSELYVQRVVHSDAAAATGILPAASVSSSSWTSTRFAAKSKGADGNNLRISYTPSKIVVAPAAPTAVTYASSLLTVTVANAPFTVGDYATLSGVVAGTGGTTPTVLNCTGVVASVNSTTVTITVTLSGSPATGTGSLTNAVLTSFSGTYWNVVVGQETVSGENPDNFANDTVLETYNNVSFTNTTSSDWIGSILSLKSQYVTVDETGGGTYTHIVPAYVGSNVSSTVLGSASSSTTTVTVTSTAGVVPGQVLSVISGTGTLTGTTVVTSVLSATTFSVNTAPSVALSSATIALTGSVVTLSGGADGTMPTNTDYTAALPIDGTCGFDVFDRPMVLFAPEIYNSLKLCPTDDSANMYKVHAAMGTWAAYGLGFAVLDTPPSQTAAQALTYTQNTSLANSRSAIYYPNLYIQDPVAQSNNALRKIGPAASVAGLYIQTDKTTGPFKSPAGISADLSGVIALETTITANDLDSLNLGTNGTVVGYPVNAVRQIPGAGVVVMGARVLAKDNSNNKYVSSKRSIIYIRKQLANLTQFALFENNNEVLWARLRTTLGAFLNQYRNQGGLRGTNPSDSFYVKIDSENNTADTIANGFVNIEIGVALERPAEFVVINLSQMTAN